MLGSRSFRYGTALSLGPRGPLVAVTTTYDDALDALDALPALPATSTIPKRCLDRHTSCCLLGSYDARYSYSTASLPLSEAY